MAEKSMQDLLDVIDEAIKVLDPRDAVAMLDELIREIE